MGAKYKTHPLNTMPEIKEEFDVKQEGQDKSLDELLEKEEPTPSEPSPEKEEKNENEELEDDKVPLHKNKRFQEIYRERKEFLEKNKELEAKLEEFAAFKEEAEKKLSSVKEQPADLPNFYKQAFHSDDPALVNSWLEFEQGLKAEVAEKVRAELEEEIKLKEYQSKNFQKFVNEELQAMKDEGKKFDDQEVIDTAVKLKLFDEKGIVNLKGAYEILEARKEKEAVLKNKPRKDIASLTNSEGGSEPTNKKVYTAKDFARKWF